MVESTRIENCAAALLVGGESRRMGRPKALLDIGGVPLYAYIARQIAPLFDEIVLIGNLPGHDAPDFVAHLRRVPDRFAERSSLNGIATALSATSAEWIALFACDGPRICVPLLRRMSALRAAPVDVVAARNDDGFLQPFHALWRSCVSSSAQSAIDAGELRVHRLLATLRVQAVEPDRWREDDPAGLFLRNLNTPDDYNELIDSE